MSKYEKFQKWLKAYIDPIVPLYALLPLLVGAMYNFLVYFGVRLVNTNWKHYDLTLAIDRQFPFIPAFVVIYIGCYLFWIYNYVLTAKMGKEHYYRFATADLVARTICLFFFLILPTENTRPLVTGSDIFSQAMRWLYRTDAADNLFPSIHCLVSWFCYIGIRGQRKVPRSYRAFSLVFAILVFLSTLFTKQHYIVDVAGGVLIAQAVYMWCQRSDFYLGYEHFFDRINRRLFAEDSSIEKKDERISGDKKEEYT